MLRSAAVSASGFSQVSLEILLLINREGHVARVNDIEHIGAEVEGCQFLPATGCLNRVERGDGNVRVEHQYRVDLFENGAQICTDEH